jgi:hypothetical protein
LAQEQARAQGYLRRLEQALTELGLPETVVPVISRKLKTQRKLFGKIFGMMFPPLFGWQSYGELCRVLGWDKNVPSLILGSLPTPTWVKLLRQVGQDVLALIEQQVQDKSPATKSRWQFTWVADDSLFKKYGSRLGLVGRGWSGQEQRVRLGIDGLLLLVVVGDGKGVIPIDFAVRRPDPKGRGRPCLDKLSWLKIMLDRTWKELGERNLYVPSPFVIADSWFGDSTLMEYVADSQQATLVVEGKSSYVFFLSDGRKVTGKAFVEQDDWPWRSSGQVPGVRYVRLSATSPTLGSVTVTIVDEPGQDRYYLLCRATPISSPRLIRAFGRRFWIEWCFRTLKTLLKSETCQMQGEEAYYGHFVLRLLAFTVLSYTARRLLRGRVTMEEMVFSIKHYWRFLESESLEWQALSWALPSEAA